MGKKLGERIAEARNNYKFYAFGADNPPSCIGMTQAMLAKRVGVSRGQISKYETGQYRPSPLQIRLIAKALGVTLEDLTGVKPAAEQANGCQTYAAASALAMERNEESCITGFGGDLLGDPVESHYEQPPEPIAAVEHILQPRYPQRKLTLAEEQAMETGKIVMWGIGIVLLTAAVVAIAGVL